MSQPKTKRLLVLLLLVVVGGQHRKARLLYSMPGTVHLHRLDTPYTAADADLLAVD